LNLPNRLTLLRIGFSFLLIFFLLIPGFVAKLAALGVFVVAALTDLWDGRLARKRKLITDFGILMDPIADKILVLSAFIAFVQLNLVSAWMVVLIAAREFLITGIRLFALGHGQVLPAENAGKHKTIAQMVVISLTLIFLVFEERLALADHSTRWLLWGESSIWFLMLITTILTVTSGVSFFWRHRKLILEL